MHNSPSLSQDPDTIEQKSAPEGAMDPTGTTTAPSTEVDLNDPNKYCALCAASFNNPQMAVQHYNGRKHQRNQTRQDLLKELGDDAQQGNTWSCLSAKQCITKAIRPCRNYIKINIIIISNLIYKFHIRISSVFKEAVFCAVSYVVEAHFYFVRDCFMSVSFNPYEMQGIRYNH